MKTNALRMIHGQPSWRLASNTVEAYVTRTGGHLGPVTFKLGARKVQPFSLAPWCTEKLPASLPPILKVLRGDFFCLPFGGNATSWKGECHPVHGETANANWTCIADLNDHGTHCLHLALNTTIRRGHVDKVLFLRDGHHAVYCRHVLTGFKGPINLGHHAMLKFPEAPGSGLISTSRFVYGQVFPAAFEDPAQGGYNSLRAGATFKSLERVPLLAGGTTDLSQYPARRGFEDLVMIVADEKLSFAWTAVVFPLEGYVWFALKNPRLLRETIFWISNAGRHYPPWNGRHVGVMGLEEVTSNFHSGLAESVAPNPISQKGYPTALSLRPDESLTIPYIMGVAAIPKGFNKVKRIAQTKEGIQIFAANGKSIKVAVAMDFLE
jgi:hypothetical protein